MKGITKTLECISQEDCIPIRQTSLGRVEVPSYRKGYQYER